MKLYALPTKTFLKQCLESKSPYHPTPFSNLGIFNVVIAMSFYKDIGMVSVP